MVHTRNSHSKDSPYETCRQNSFKLHRRVEEGEVKIMKEIIIFISLWCSSPKILKSIPRVRPQKEGDDSREHTAA